jgi:hypothetical protein
VGNEDASTKVSESSTCINPTFGASFEARAAPYAFGPKIAVSKAGGFIEMDDLFFDNFN